MRDELIKITEKFEGKRILVIGDIMLDKYIWGNVTRISPEAPVQVVHVEKQSVVLGGAANTANNVASLKGTVSIIGVTGEDDARDRLIDELKKKGIMIDGIMSEKNRQTIQKVRIMAQNQQLLRVDYEDGVLVSKEAEGKMIHFLKKSIDGFDGVVISDYFKGIVTKDLIKEASSLIKAHGKFLIIDPKPAHTDYYNDVDLITPNHKEACEMLNLNPELSKDESSIEMIGSELKKRLDCNILLTRGEQGMALFLKSGEVIKIPTKAKEVYDVSGAGDTVVASFALALAAGADYKQAAHIANYAAGIVVGKLGTATTTVSELKKAIEDEQSDFL
ncbi:MAG TPA: D-glycero-beta-D-manno-heptose-7-phosphate kinase [Candidatus Nanoarchaeia archaeon]|nr:D-glycero-beta-D-manno-heptose-7-phosphate kinase [Candidatus Nanoarchaeia archaeon]